MTKHLVRRRRKRREDAPVLWRRLGTLVVIALPVFLFLPGIGFETSHPASLARQGAGNATWFYRVRADDVLTTIAERQLGTLRRYKEIVALNPGIKPRALTVGSILRMPPKNGQTGAAGAPTLPPVAATGQSPRRLLLAFAALLGLVVLVVAVASHLERRAAEA